MAEEIKPSLEIWNYFKGDITSLQVVTYIADIIGGYHVSYSAKELLKDLKLLTKKGRPTKEARRLVAWYLHEKYHRSINPLVVIDPTNES